MTTANDRERAIQALGRHSDTLGSDLYVISDYVRTLEDRVAELTRERDAARTALRDAEKDTDALKGALETISVNAPDDDTPPTEMWKWKFWVAGQTVRAQLYAFARRDRANAAAALTDDGGA